LWLALSGIISVAWVANFFAPLLFASYRPDSSINNAFMAVVGAFAAAHVAQAERHGQRQDDTKGPTP
jgi:hypothetical protein